eukprot:2606843-Rhodomonas_salina.1
MSLPIVLFPAPLSPTSAVTVPAISHSIVVRNRLGCSEIWMAEAWSTWDGGKRDVGQDLGVQVGSVGEGDLLEAESPGAHEGLEPDVGPDVRNALQHLHEPPGRGEGLGEVDPEVCQTVEPGLVQRHVRVEGHEAPERHLPAHDQPHAAIGATHPRVGYQNAGTGIKTDLPHGSAAVGIKLPDEEHHQVAALGQPGAREAQRVLGHERELDDAQEAVLQLRERARLSLLDHASLSSTRLCVDLASVRAP